MPEEGINQVTFPAEVAHIWAWFTRLDAARQPAFAGLSPITYEAMAAFFTLQGIKPQPWEVDAIKALDRVAVDSRQIEKATQDVNRRGNNRH
jgi:hypothetical protein